MEIQICAQCDYPMEDSPFRVCWTCWKSNQGYARTKADERYDGLQATLQKLQNHTAKVETRSEAYLKKARQFKAQRDQLRNRTSDVDPDVLRRLISFCHPDKNTERQEEATELTKLLLALRPKDP